MCFACVFILDALKKNISNWHRRCQQLINCAPFFYSMRLALISILTDNLWQLWRKTDWWKINYPTILWSFSTKKLGKSKLFLSSETNVEFQFHSKRLHFGFVMWNWIHQWNSTRSSTFRMMCVNIFWFDANLGVSIWCTRSNSLQKINQLYKTKVFKCIHSHIYTHTHMNWI